MKRLLYLLFISITTVAASDKEASKELFSIAGDEDHQLVLPAAWILVRRLNKIDYELTKKSPLVARLAGKIMIPSQVWHIVVETSSEYDHKHKRNKDKTSREHCDKMSALLEAVLKDCPEALEELHDYGLYRADEIWDGDNERHIRAKAEQLERDSRFAGLLYGGFGGPIKSPY